MKYLLTSLILIGTCHGLDACFKCYDFVTTELCLVEYMLFYQSDLSTQEEREYASYLNGVRDALLKTQQRILVNHMELKE